MNVWGLKAGIGQDSIRGKLGEDEDDGNWCRSNGRCYTSEEIQAKYVVLVLGLTLFIDEQVGSGAIRNTGKRWLCLVTNMHQRGCWCGWRRCRGDESVLLSLLYVELRGSAEGAIRTRAEVVLRKC